jgi:hypothetical protein
MKFSNPLEYQLRDGFSLLVPAAWLNSKGLPVAEIQLYNGTLAHSDLICLSNQMARGRFIKSVGQRSTIGADEVEQALLLIGGNLATTLNQELEDEAGASSKTTQATRLVELAQAAHLFYAPDKEAYATIEVGDHKETWPIRVRGFRQWLRRRFYEQTGSVPSSQAVQEAVEQLEGKASFDGKEEPVYTRVAELDGKIYLDIANDKWEAIEITKAGWSVVADPPVKFRRTRGMLALPHPVRGGSIDELRVFVNVTDADWILLIEWLVGAYRPRGPYPILILHGEQGSAKSTTARILRNLIDPNVAPLRSEPRDERDLMIAATNGWCIALDNLSHLSQWLSNGLCRLATGGGFATRELYSNNEEALFDAMRPVLLTGIQELATESDLTDRALILFLPEIEETKRRPEAEFWQAYEEASPRILGAFLDAVSAALRNVDSVSLKRLPRMADFAIWGTAAESALGIQRGKFIEAYTTNRKSANDMALESSHVPIEIRALMECRESWEGTAQELLEELNKHASDTIQKQRGWPKAPRPLTNALRRFTPNLRAAGITVKFKVRKTSRGWTLSIDRACNVKPAESLESQATDKAVENEQIKPSEASDETSDDSDETVSQDNSSECIESQAKHIEIKAKAVQSDSSGDSDLRKQAHSEADKLESSPQSVARVPFMITRQMRQELADLGYSKGEVDRMTPEQAWEIIGSNQTNDSKDKAIERGICPTCGSEGILFSDCGECGDLIRTRL